MKNKTITKKTDNICNVCNVEQKEDTEEFKTKKRIITLLIGVYIYLLPLILKIPFLIGFIMFLVSYVIVGYDIVWKAVRNI